MKFKKQISFYCGKYIFVARSKTCYGRIGHVSPFILSSDNGKHAMRKLIVGILFISMQEAQVYLNC